MLPPGMRSVLGCGAPVRMLTDHRVPAHHHHQQQQQQPTSAAAAAAAAGLLSRAAYRLAGLGGLRDAAARGRAQLAALAGFGVVVGGSPINHHYQHAHYSTPPYHYRPGGPHAPLAAYPGARHQFLPSAPVFTPADLHLVLYGYARSRSQDDKQQTAATGGGAHSLSGLRINELSYGMLK